MANIYGALWVSGFKALSELFGLGEDEKKVGFTRIKSTNLVFKLHTVVTVGFLFLASGLLQISKFTGSPIVCGDSGVPSSITKPATQYCWTSSTFVLTRRETWSDDVHKGLGSDRCDGDGEGPGCVFKMKYYQWTAWVLIVQALFFYVPRWFWNNVEMGLLGSVVTSASSLKGSSHPDDKGQIKDLAASVVGHLGHWTTLAYGFLGIEVAMALNVAFQMFFLDAFLGTFTMNKDGKAAGVLNFGNLGSSFIDYWRAGKWGETEMTTSPGFSLFPRMSKCNFTLYGQAGDPTQHQYLCFLFLNNINEKVYLIMWFWFYFLIAVSVLQIVRRVLSFTVLRGLARRNLRASCKRTKSDISDLAEPSNCKSLMEMSEDIPVGVVFVLDIIKGNVAHPDVFKETLLQTLMLLKTKKSR